MSHFANSADRGRRCRCYARNRDVGLAVRAARRDDYAYEASAYVMDDGHRCDLVNAAGVPLVAFGRTPVAAASHLLAALRRGCSEKM